MVQLYLNCLLIYWYKYAIIYIETREEENPKTSESIDNMKEVTITRTIQLPTNEEIEAVVRKRSPIKPQLATVITCFVENYSYLNDNEKVVYNCMKNADTELRNSIASDVVVAYCDLRGIKWSTLEIMRVTDYGSHFVIEAIAKIGG